MSKKLSEMERACCWLPQKAATEQEDHVVAALNRALEIYFSVNGEAADAAALAAVISDTRCMATDLWCMHILGPDDVHAAPSKFHAEKAAAAFNERFGPISKETDVMCRAVVEPWPHSPESHAADVGKFCAEWFAPIAEKDHG